MQEHLIKTNPKVTKVVSNSFVCVRREERGGGVRGGSDDWINVSWAERSQKCHGGQSVKAAPCCKCRSPPSVVIFSSSIGDVPYLAI